MSDDRELVDVFDQYQAEVKNFHAAIGDDDAVGAPLDRMFALSDRIAELPDAHTHEGLSIKAAVLWDRVVDQEVPDEVANLARSVLASLRKISGHKIVGEYDLHERDDYLGLGAR